MNRRFLLESLLNKPKKLKKPTINVQYVGGGTNARVTFTNPSDPLGTMYYKSWEQGDSEPSTYDSTTSSTFTTPLFTLSTPNNTVHAKAYVVNELGTSEITET